MSESVTIKVPARLHLGFLDIPRSGTDRFGSVGLPVQDIATVLTISRSAETQVHGDEQARIEQHVAALCNHLGIKAQHRINVQRAIPRHIGLGSGTQIALAVAAAIRTLHGLPLDAVNDAVLLGRGSRSGIGIAAFEEGGVIVDAGKGAGGAAPTVISRIPFPESWRIILVFDASTQGIHGEAEIEAFRTLPPFPVETSAAICRHVLMGIMPGLIEQDLPSFGRAVEAIQAEIGNYFAPAQGGVFTSKHVEATIRRLAQAGAVGIGQSSWGPTGFAFAASQTEATRIVDAIGGQSLGTTIQIVAGRNAGADITHTTLNFATA
ncbi:beta-ribofuranosylaminobenzene 5'-phosphate synthase family protein [Phyllobacterium sp. P5_D12]